MQHHGISAKTGLTSGQSAKERARLLHRLVLHSDDVPCVGLFHGQMGILLVLARCARQYRQKPLRLVSEYLLDKVLASLAVETPLDFAHGLCGIGWGVEYLLQNGYMQGNRLEVCEVIDRRLAEVAVSRVWDCSVETGMEGWLHYMLAHLQGMPPGRLPYSADCLDEWCRRLRLALVSGESPTASFSRLAKTFLALCAGEPWHYSFALSPFVAPQAKANAKRLGLRSGLAGYIECHELNAFEL